MITQLSQQDQKLAHIWNSYGMNKALIATRLRVSQGTLSPFFKKPFAPKKIVRCNRQSAGYVASLVRCALLASKGKLKMVDVNINQEKALKMVRNELLPLSNYISNNKSDFMGNDEYEKAYDIAVLIIAFGRI